ncbi:YufK family protein [Bacillus smithii]|jgi:hypothetical protein|uniref:YufK family protein n=1 Tax=Bacillus smithii TaxID=1479 RepID=UPI002E1C3811|nr:YufK family protein [Bacillus smithii]
MKNTYLTGYFPFLTILLFSLSLAIYVEDTIMNFLKQIGIYQGMLGIISETELKLAVIIGLIAVFFMALSALKVVAETINELALLFFSTDTDGDILKNVRNGSLIFLAGGLVSLCSYASIIGIIAIFLLTVLIYFIYFVYKISPSLTTSFKLVGFICFQIVVWGFITSALLYMILKIYNTAMAGLPI